MNEDLKVEAFNKHNNFTWGKKQKQETLENDTYL
jgi:hypothetical protein